MLIATSRRRSPSTPVFAVDDLTHAREFALGHVGDPALVGDSRLAADLTRPGPADAEHIGQRDLRRLSFGMFTPAMRATAAPLQYEKRRSPPERFTGPDGTIPSPLR